MPPSAATDRRPIAVIAVTGLLFGWLAVQIFDARDQLDHYGVDPTPVGALAG